MIGLGLDKRSEPYNPNSSWDKSVPQGSIPSAHLETQVLGKRKS